MTSLDSEQFKRRTGGEDTWVIAETRKTQCLDLVTYALQENRQSRRLEAYVKMVERGETVKLGFRTDAITST